MLCNLRCQEWNHVALRRTSSCHEQRCSLGMESAGLTAGALSYLISQFSAEIRTMENEQCWGEGTNSSCALGITAKAGCALKFLMAGNWCQIMSRETQLGSTTQEAQPSYLTQLLHHFWYLHMPCKLGQWAISIFHQKWAVSTKNDNLPGETCSHFWVQQEKRGKKQSQGVSMASSAPTALLGHIFHLLQGYLCYTLPVTMLFIGYSLSAWYENSPWVDALEPGFSSLLYWGRKMLFPSCWISSERQGHIQILPSRPEIPFRQVPYILPHILLAVFSHHLCFIWQIFIRLKIFIRSLLVSA